MMNRLLLSLAVLLITLSTASAQLSVDVGGTREVQYGTFVAPCGCTFQPSGGWGFVGDVRYDFASTDPLGFGAAAGVHYMHYTTYEEPGHEDSTDVARIGMTYLTIEPSVRYASLPFVVRLGANVGLLMGNSYEHESRPIADPEEDVDSSMGDLRTLRLAARLSAGYELPMGSVAIVPTLAVEYPFNTIRDEQASGWKVVTYIASVGLRF